MRLRSARQQFRYSRNVIMKKILVITTGGTIACETTENGRAPVMGGTELTAGIKDCEITVKDIFSCDSTDITPEHWREIYKAVKSTCGYDGIVILHGTDTLEYTAAVLYYTLSDLGVPVIITGAMIPMSENNSDGGQNIRDAVTAACDNRLTGVYAVFCGRIISGGNIIKRRSIDTDAFRSFCGGDCGYISNSVITINYEAEKPESITLPETDRNIAILQRSPFTRELYVPDNYDGVVIESFGAGGIPSVLSEELKALCKRMTVIITTSCEDGANLREYEVGQRAIALGAIDGREMTTARAAVSLWLGI